MKVGKPHIGTVLAIVCLVLLVSSFFLPWWTIEREVKSPIAYPSIYVNSTHDFKLTSVSTIHVDTHPGGTSEERLETSYFDVEDSDLGLHFLMVISMVSLAIAFIVLFLVLNRLSERKESYRLVALGLGFAVVFMTLGSAAYLNMVIPSAVGDSRASLGSALHSDIPNIQSFAGIDLDETISQSVTTTWGPSIGWYLVFVVCVIMLFSIWFTESRPKTEEEPEDELED